VEDRSMSERNGGSWEYSTVRLPMQISEPEPGIWTVLFSPRKWFLLGLKRFASTVAHVVGLFLFICALALAVLWGLAEIIDFVAKRLLGLTY
jgi:hypothetical protein